MRKNVLMIAYHIPPLKGSSGILRTLNFCKYLPEFGWHPAVLSTSIKAYEHVDYEGMESILPDIPVVRAFALDTKRHLSIKSSYPILLAIPDRWVSWLFGGVISGLIFIKKFKPSIIWSTYPIATAHLIGYALHRLSGLPWIADLRDPMAQDGYPENRVQWKSFKWIEKRIVRHASAICFTCQSAKLDFINQHRNINEKKLYVIENGYDEEAFQQAESLALENRPSSDRPVTLVHSGIIYPSERDPRPFFEAIKHLKTEGLICNSSLKVILRATGHDDMITSHLASYGIDDIVELAPPLNYVEALAEMINADGLILLQAGNCNSQIPAKIYEYLRSGRPIFGLTDIHGDTATLLIKFPRHIICDISSSEQIKTGFINFLNRINITSDKNQIIHIMNQYSRKERTRELANLLDSTLSNLQIGE